MSKAFEVQQAQKSAENLFAESASYITFKKRQRAEMIVDEKQNLTVPMILGIGNPYKVIWRKKDTVGLLATSGHLFVCEISNNLKNYEPSGKEA